MAGQVSPAETGIIAREAEAARSAIAASLAARGLTPRGPIDMRPLPFAGTWGTTSSVALQLGGEIAMTELESAGKLEGLSKKEAKQLAGDATRLATQTLAEGIVADLDASGQYAQVEAANGFINITFNARQIAHQLVTDVLAQGHAYGQGSPKSERVMVEHSQPNTHKSFHVGHLRNSCIGIAVSNIQTKAGYPVMQATYPGDIGMHVIKCLWCYQKFHDGQEPADPLQRGRWLGNIYTESDQRLNIQKEAIGFLNLLTREDKVYGLAIDRLLKRLYKTGAEGEDISYILGRVMLLQDLDAGMLRRADVIAAFWPILGEHLQDVVDRPEMIPTPVNGDPEPTTTPEERLQTWTELAPQIGWFQFEPEWREEVRQEFQRWEAKDPAFVALWERTREWSLNDFRRIFDELGAHFDVWFFESQVEEEGREIVRELVEQWSRGDRRGRSDRRQDRRETRPGKRDVPDDADFALGRHHAVLDQGSGADQAEVR